MKTIIRGLLVLFGLTSSMVSADFLDEEDDTYVGFQMKTSLDSMSRGMFSGQNQYSYFLVQQSDGIKDGLSITQDANGNRVLNYLRPSATPDFTQYRVAEYAVPIMSLEAQDGSDTRKSGSNNSANNAAVVLVALVLVNYKLKKDLEKEWKPAD